MSKFKRIRTSFAFNIISSIIVMIIAFSLVISAIGYVSFTETLKREYTITTYHMAETATGLVDGNKIETYLSVTEDNHEYGEVRGYLDSYCNKMDVTLLYVLKVDANEDYNVAYNVFDLINRKEDRRYNRDGKYSGRSLGEKVEGHNIENYRETYKKIYEGELEYGIVYRLKNLKSRDPHLTVVVPIKDDDGNVTAVLSIQRPMSELVNGRRPYMITIAISTAALILLISLVAILYLRHQFVRPIKDVIDEAKNFSVDKHKGNLNKKKKSSILEIKDLSESVNKMEDDMLKYIENLTAVTSEKERISTELGIASVIQENSIPNIFPAFPDRLDFDIFANMTPAKEVGGDFYNFYLVDDDNLAIVIADVSGKGVPAALFMMVTNILINEKLLSGTSVKDALTIINKRICRRNITNMFVTVWLGKLNLKTGVLTCANAGHNDPIICKNGKKFEIKKLPHDLVVGALPETEYKEYQIKLNKGDKLFLYTDGINEAINTKNELFGVDRIIDCLNETKTKTCQAIINAVKHSVVSFAGDAPQFDDMTMVCFEYNGEELNNKLVVDAKLYNLDKVINFMNKYLEDYNVTKDFLNKIHLSVEELFVNICNYAYSDDIGPFTIVLEVDNDILTIAISDSGVKFNPLEKADPNILEDASDRQIGGLGIFLVKKNMDSVEYSYVDNKNIVVMKKNIK